MKARILTQLPEFLRCLPIIGWGGRLAEITLGLERLEAGQTLCIRQHSDYDDSDRWLIMGVENSSMWWRVAPAEWPEEWTIDYGDPTVGIFGADITHESCPLLGDPDWGRAEEDEFTRVQRDKYTDTCTQSYKCKCGAVYTTAWQEPRDQEESQDRGE